MAIRALLLIKLVTICSLCMPPHYQLQKHELQSLIDQLPEPNLVLGDFSAHIAYGVLLSVMVEANLLNNLFCPLVHVF